MLSVNMLNVIMLNVIAECHYAECRCTVKKMASLRIMTILARGQLVLDTNAGKQQT